MGYTTQCTVLHLSAEEFRTLTQVLLELGVHEGLMRGAFWQIPAGGQSWPSFWSPLRERPGYHNYVVSHDLGEEIVWAGGSRSTYSHGPWAKVLPARLSPDVWDQIEDLVTRGIFNGA